MSYFSTKYRGISLLAAVVVLLAFSVIISAHDDVPALIVADGDPADWPQLEPIAVGTERAKELYAFTDGHYLYLLAYTSDLGGDFQNFFIDINGPATGFQLWKYMNSGADYLVQNGELYESNSSAWDWTSVGAVDYAVADAPDDSGLKVLEVVIDINDWEITDSIRVAFHLEEPDEFLPDSLISMAVVKTIEVVN